jgi:hypothetical protein
LGAIDCTHIDIRQPSANPTDYIKARQNWFPVYRQAF